MCVLLESSRVHAGSPLISGVPLMYVFPERLVHAGVRQVARAIVAWNTRAHLDPRGGQLHGGEGLRVNPRAFLRGALPFLRPAAAHRTKPVTSQVLPGAGARLGTRFLRKGTGACGTV